ncbi:MAG: HU family DNA-binding protein [Myxococcales bacterium]|nr:HU family DNA-binding protein [Myxococcales bacterium]
MTRKELVTALRDRLSEGEFGPELALLSKRDLGVLIDLTFETISEAIVADGRFSHPGFGTFSAKTTPPRPGRNPRTGEALIVPERRQITFKASERLRAE